MTLPARALRPAPPRLGFLGIGWIGLKRLELLIELGDAEIAAVCDPARDRVARARARAIGAAACSSFDELVDLDLDGIVIGAPGALSARQCLDCLEWGLPIFCHQPLQGDAEQTTAVVLEAQTQDCLLEVDLCYRHLPAIEAVMDLASSGELGDLYAARLSFHNGQGPDPTWFRDPRLSGGGCVVDLGIHLVDLAVRVLGSPVATVESGCFAGGEPLVRPIVDRLEDYATARLRLESGAEVNLACSWNAALGQDAVIEADFFGTRGSARLRNVSGSLYDFVAAHAQGGRSRILAESSDDGEPWALARWARRLGQGVGFDCEAWDLVQLARVVDVIYGRGPGSAARSQPVVAA